MSLGHNESGLLLMIGLEITGKQIYRAALWGASVLLPDFGNICRCFLLDSW
jgi:hypothetical protein